MIRYRRDSRWTECFFRLRKKKMMVCVSQYLPTYSEFRENSYYRRKGNLPAAEEVLKTVLDKPASDIIKEILSSNNTAQKHMDEMCYAIESSLCNYSQTPISIYRWTSQLYQVMDHYYSYIFVLLRIKKSMKECSLPEL